MRNQKADRFVQVGLAHHQAGRLDQANTAYQEALSENPEHPDALHLLGMLAHQVGNHELARDLINLALHANPHSPVFHCNLGTVAQSQGKLDEAITCFRKAIQINPANAVFHYNLGHALQKQGHLQAAIAAYRQALSLAPNHIESLSNLGHCLLMAGETVQALECFRQAATLAPNLPEMHFNLGTAFSAQSRLDEASASYRQAIALFPDYAQAHCNLGAALLAQGHHDEAISSYRQALTYSPGMAEAHYNLGIALQARDQLDEAIASYRRTLELQPDFVEGHCNLGNALRAQGRLDDAAECYRTALALRPGYANAYSNLLFLTGYHATLAPEEYLAQARGWELACIPPDIRHTARQRTFVRSPLAGRRLKVGYVSGDFRKHAVSYFMERLLACHDRTRVELYAYSNNRTRDDVTERLNALFDHWVPISGIADEDVCQRIAADGIDVLIDLSAHSAHNRLGVFARRAAPVQATYLYFASTGLSEMDYWIGDATLAPPEMDGHFSEKVWRLPRTWLSYKTIAEAPLPAWQPAADGSICLGCFNNLGKITPPTLRLWARIMHALPTRAIASASWPSWRHTASLRSASNSNRAATGTTTWRNMTVSTSPSTRSPHTAAAHRPAMRSGWVCRSSIYWATTSVRASPPLCYKVWATTNGSRIRKRNIWIKPSPWPETCRYANNCALASANGWQTARYATPVASHTHSKMPTPTCSDAG